MSEETIVAVFDSAEQADAAVRDLMTAEVPESAISRHAGAASGAATMTDAAVGEPRREEGFWSRLFGGDRDYDHEVYDRSVASGSTVISVRVPEAHVMQVSEILDRHHPIDIDERASGYGLAGTTAEGASGVAPVGYTGAQYASPVARSTGAEVGSDGVSAGGAGYQTANADLTNAGAGAVAPTGLGAERIGAATGDTMQLSEERLTVGKRLVNRGTTRVRRYVIETPVEEQVSLREERVTVDRRPVTGAAAPTDGSFSERTIEMTESREEAVVSKTAHVAEEVRLRKEGVDRVETVRDTVRREDVDVEQLPGETVARPPT